MLASLYCNLSTVDGWKNSRNSSLPIRRAFSVPFALYSLGISPQNGGRAGGGPTRPKIARASPGPPFSTHSSPRFLSPRGSGQTGAFVRASVHGDPAALRAEGRSHCRAGPASSPLNCGGPAAASRCLLEAMRLLLSASHCSISFPRDPADVRVTSRRGWERGHCSLQTQP
ncbi:hypothetical protein Bbelb_095600 [Branchiostoma belcheri]|nr:hypothetical protein Bbelb_095600 [Branchiostoma belcheri]